MQMKEDDWSAVLNDHPIFDRPNNIKSYDAQGEFSLELSTNSLKFTSDEGGHSSSGRRQVTVLKNEDMIVAAGAELRMTSLGDSKSGRSTRKAYKTLHTPNIQFEINQLVLNPSGKLLAVAGAFQVAVVVLPRSGYSRLVPSAIDCKSIQVGQFYHTSQSSAAIVKIEWHPWGEAGSTLMVMTVDGKLREYDISVNTEEPQQVLSFVSEKRTKSYFAEDPSEREVASFTLGRGKADWGPLTVYAVMRSGDIYSICPYMPRNASIPSSYIHALETFTTAKRDFLSEEKNYVPKAQSTLYNHQSLYIKTLTKQLPNDMVLGTSSRSVIMHPPTTTSVPHKVARQGPFLLQPSPRTLKGSEGGNATDVVYLAFDTDEDDEGEGETERLGVVLVVFQDGKVDVCLDVEKVEARWETKGESGRDLPMLAVYETIDLGLVSMLNKSTGSNTSLLDLLTGNYPVFHIDPIHDDTVYVYHGFGVHALYLGPMLQSLATALRGEDAAELTSALQKCSGTNVQPILTTFSVERRCSNPVIAVAVPNDVYLSYGIFILTSAWRICTFPLTLRSESPLLKEEPLNVDVLDSSQYLTTLPGPPAYISLLANEPFIPDPILSRSAGLPSNPRLALGSSTKKQEFLLTPDSLRYFATTVQNITRQIHGVQLAQRAAENRSELQLKEFQQQQIKCQEMIGLIEKLRGPRLDAINARVDRIKAAQKVLSTRSDRILQTLVNNASPELSEHETKWFEELRRMKEDVSGAGRYDEGSLAARAQTLQREYQRLLPSLKDLLKLESERQKLSKSTQGLGLSQAFELGQRSNNGREKIAGIEKDILKLAATLELAVGRPPDQSDRITVNIKS